MIAFNQPYMYNDLVTRLDTLVQNNPEILTRKNIGCSHDERLIYGVWMGKSEKCLICTAGVHGRESINPVLMVRMIEEYCNAWKSGDELFSFSIRKLLMTYSILFIPLVNPDGYDIAMGGFDKIRNPLLRHVLKLKMVPSETWKCNARGIDINRNFPCDSFNISVHNKESASEYETKALIETFQSFPNSVGYIDFHSRGRIIYYYRNAMPASYNREGRKLAKKLQLITGYELGKKSDEFETRLSGGNSVNYYSETFQKPALTVETVEDEATFPMKVSYQPGTYLEIREIPLTFLWEIQLKEESF